MKVLDLFSGLGGWSQAFKTRGHTVITVDAEKKFNPTICADVIELSRTDFENYLPFDLVLASPPCNCFSVCTISKYWTPDKRPSCHSTVEAIRLVGHTVKLILDLQPRWWILENPRGMLRNVLGKPSATTFFASWGHFAYKPTDLWGVLPQIEWRKPKKWEKSPRSACKGISRSDLKSEDRSHIPFGLSEAVCLACEYELKAFSKG